LGETKEKEKRRKKRNEGKRETKEKEKRRKKRNEGKSTPFCLCNETIYTTNYTISHEPQLITFWKQKREEKRERENVTFDIRRLIILLLLNSKIRTK
jgi:hypothetical protein